MISGDKMKILKRVIVFFVGIVLCCVLNCNYVFADNIPTYYISEKINADKTLTAKISFTEDAVAAGTIILSYNTDRMELLSAEKGTSKAQMITLNDNELGVVTINFLNAEDVIKDDTSIAVLKFSINSDEISEYDINVESFKLYNLDSKLLSDNTTTVPVYKLDKENMPDDISVTSRVETVSHQPSKAETPAENSDMEASSTESRNVDNDSKNNSSQTQEKSNVSDSTEDVFAVQQNTSEVNTSEEKEASDDSNSSEKTVQESKGETSPAQSQSDADMIQGKEDNTILTVIALSVVILIATCAAIIIIKKQKSNKKTGGNENEK